jgi:hypothetical protein
VHRYSDANLLAALKARRPEDYREGANVSVSVVPVELVDVGASLAGLAEVLRAAGAMPLAMQAALEAEAT